MKLHEFRAKQLFAQHGIPIPGGRVAAVADEAADAARQLGGSAWVVKAQVHAGGRGAGRFEGAAQGAGGVRFAGSVDEVRSAAADMLGHVLVTEQTGPAGREVRRVYVEQSLNVERELYLAMLVDRRTSRVTAMLSASGGGGIEAVASTSPEAILKLAVDPLEGLQPSGLEQFVSALDLSENASATIARIVASMYDMFMSLDASLIEINPLAVTAGGEVLALDATITFDDNALFRHGDLQSLRDEGESAWGELDATLHGLNYVKLNGNIGCMANGAGLAMATVDVVKFYGGEPANFLDVPPAVEVERVKYAFELILSDPNVEAVLVNIFGGGIMRCDTVADAMILAFREVSVHVPVVVRFAGVNSEFGKVRLKEAGLPVTFADDLADAADKAVRAAWDATVAVRRNWWERVRGLLSKHDDDSDASHGDSAAPGPSDTKRS
jgi:succinyl-CoA synthetase beta subunit